MSDIKTIEQTTIQVINSKGLIVNLSTSDSNTSKITLNTKIDVKINSNKIVLLKG